MTATLHRPVPLTTDHLRRVAEALASGPPSALSDLADAIEAEVEADHRQFTGTYTQPR